MAQNVPQGPAPLPITTHEETTNIVAQAADTAVATNQANTAKVSLLMDAGIQYADEGEYKEAEQAYLRALKEDPGNPNIRFRLSTLYIFMKKHAEAVEMMEKLVKEYPDNPSVFNNLAWEYATAEEVRNGTLALRYAREAILIQPDAPSLWNTLAEAYYVFGQYDKALRASEYAADLLRLQNAPDEQLKEFAAQRAKIQRADEAYKMLLGLDGEE